MLTSIYLFFAGIVHCLIGGSGYAVALQISAFFIYEGDISYENNNGTLSEFTMSRFQCAAECLQDLSCNAIELCSTPSGQTCRLSKGWKNTGGTLSQATCRRFQIVDECEGESYLDRGSGNCTYVNTVFYTSSAYSYHTVSRYGITCAGKSYVTFKVRACSDAHLALMTYDSDSGPLYEIVIGGWSNGKCCLRKSKQGSCYRTYQGSVLNCDSYQYFWVSWGGSVIRLGKGTTYGSNTLMSLSDSSISVNYIAVSTGWGSTGYWEFYTQL